MDLDYCKSNSCPFHAEAEGWKSETLASGLRNIDLCLDQDERGCLFGCSESRLGRHK